MHLVDSLAVEYTMSHGSYRFWRLEPKLSKILAQTLPAQRPRRKRDHFKMNFHLPTKDVHKKHIILVSGGVICFRFFSSGKLHRLQQKTIHLVLMVSWNLNHGNLRVPPLCHPPPGNTALLRDY